MPMHRRKARWCSEPDLLGEKSSGCNVSCISLRPKPADLMKVVQVVEDELKRPATDAYLSNGWTEQIGKDAIGR